MRDPRALPLSSRDSGVAAVRDAVRAFLREADVNGTLAAGSVTVAVSGGPDSLALAALARPVAAERNVTVRGLVVDHGLQPGSAQVAARAAEQLEALDIPAKVLGVTVGTAGGMEAAARSARYAALREAAEPGSLVLLGHTRDDQAETVLLGLGRGSGPRSIAGMRAHDPPWGRPLLVVPRAATVAACAALGLDCWSDPHNVDPRFTRVRVRREALPLLEDVLAGGVAPALARTAAQLREDLDELDRQAGELYEAVHVGGGLPAGELAGTSPAIRRRVLRRWLLGAGVPELTDAQLRAVDALVGDWHGQGGVHLPSGSVVSRTHGTLHVHRN